MLIGPAPAFAGEADAASPDDAQSLVDIYCSQTAKDALDKDQLQSLAELIVTSIEPQAVNLLTGKFSCFEEAAANDELGREIGLYIYYGAGDKDGLSEHEDAFPGVYAYVLGSPAYDENKSYYEYLICMDAESLCTTDETGNARLELDDPTRIQLDTTFCHELFHAFMDDYNRVGMSGYTDAHAYFYLKSRRRPQPLQAVG